MGSSRLFCVGLNIALIGLMAVACLDVFAQTAGTGTIVYERFTNESDPGADFDISSMNADGTNNKILTNDGHSHSPNWSPDGRRILFVHDSTLQEGSYKDRPGANTSRHSVELYVMARNGGNSHLLRRLEPGIEKAAWSPDGRMLAVSLKGGTFLLGPDGQGEPRMFVPNAYSLAWSPNGMKIAFSTWTDRWSVHVANADGSNTVQLTDPHLNAYFPTWSPDGKRIAFQASGYLNDEQGIFVMNADGSGVRQLTTDPKWQSCGHPSWSPDGKQITFFCHMKSVPCAGGGFPGQERCHRRIFVTSPDAPPAQLIPVTEHDGAFPAFAPTQQPSDQDSTQTQTPLSAHSYSTTAVWGSPVNGLELSLSIDTSVVLPSHTPALKLYLQNVGTHDLSVTLGASCALPPNSTNNVGLILTDSSGTSKRLIELGPGPPYPSGCGGVMGVDAPTLSPGELFSTPIMLDYYGFSLLASTPGGKDSEQGRQLSGTYTLQAEINAQLRNGRAERDFDAARPAKEQVDRHGRHFFVWLGTIKSNQLEIHFPAP